MITLVANVTIHELKKRLNMKTRLKAVTLPMVLVISVLIILVVLFVYSLWEMNFFHYSSYHYKKTTTGEPEFRHCLILQRQYFF